MFGQFACTSVGHHGKAPALFASAGGFDRGIERQQVGLVGNAVDHADNAADFAGFVGQLRHVLGGVVDGVDHLADFASGLPSMRSLLARFSARAATSSTRRDDCARLVILLPSSSTALAIDAVDAPSPPRQRQFARSWRTTRAALETAAGALNIAHQLAQAVAHAAQPGQQAVRTGAAAGGLAARSPWAMRDRASLTTPGSPPSGALDAAHQPHANGDGSSRLTLPISCSHSSNCANGSAGGGAGWPARVLQRQIVVYGLQIYQRGFAGLAWRARAPAYRRRPAAGDLPRASSASHSKAPGCRAVAQPLQLAEMVVRAGAAFVLAVRFSGSFVFAGRMRDRSRSTWLRIMRLAGVVHLGDLDVGHCRVSAQADCPSSGGGYAFSSNSSQQQGDAQCGSVE